MENKMPQTMENSLPQLWKIKCPFMENYLFDKAYYRFG